MNLSSAEIGKRASRAVDTIIAISIAKTDRKPFKRCMLGKIITFLNIVSYLSQKLGFGISCKLSP